MKPLSSLLCLIFTVALLSGCSYFDIGEGPDVTSNNPQSINLMGPTQRLESADLMNITNGASDGDVTIFSLDGPSGGAPVSMAEPSGSSAPAAVGPGAPVHAYDPAVEIFPLDDKMGELLHPTGASMMVATRPTPYEAEPLLNSQQGPQPLPEDTPQPVAVMGRPVSVYFGHNSSQLSAEAASAVDSVGRNLKGGEGLSVEGHASVRANYADEIQKRVVNLRVSMNRALAVAAKLIEGGVPASSIQTVAWGDTKAPTQVADMDAETAARRVDIFTKSLQ